MYLVESLDIVLAGLVIGKIRVAVFKMSVWGMRRPAE